MNPHRQPPIRAPRSARGVLALAAAVAFAAPAVSSAQPPGAIAGRVRDAATGLPVAGIEVQALLYPSDSFVAGRAVTDAAGRYRIGGLFPDLYLARVEHGAAGYVGQIYDRVPCWGGLAFRERFSSFSCGFGTIVPDPVTVEPGRTARGVDFSLDRGGVIAGTVTAAATGQPLEGVTVELTWSTTARTTTDAAGRYRFEGLAPTGYWVQTRGTPGLADEIHPGFHCPYEECSESFSEDFRVRPGLGEVVDRIDFALERLGTIGGVVADAASGLPLRGMTVTIFSTFEEVASTETGISGLWIGGELPPGPYWVTAGDGPGPYVDELFEGAPCVGPGEGLQCDLASGSPIAVEAASAAAVSFDLEAGGAIAGRVTAGGAPLAGVEVTARAGTQRAVAVAGDDGRYRLDGLPPGAYAVFTGGAAARGFADELYRDVPCLEPGRCPAGEPEPVELAPGEEIAEIDFALEPFGAIAGAVTEAATGEGIAFSRLRIWAAPGVLAAVAGPTDQAGRFTSPPLPRGSYTVETGGRSGEWAGELYEDVLCPLGANWTCGVGQGTPVAVRPGETSEGIDVALEPLAGFRCRPTASGVCLADGRFWVSVLETRGMASPLPLTGEASAFTFADPSNPEVAVRLIDACEPFDAWWVFATGLTDRNTLATVIDSASGQAWHHVNFPEEQPFPAVLDARGLAVCDVAFAAGSTAGASGSAATEVATGAAAPGTGPVPAAGALQGAMLAGGGLEGAPSSGPCVPAPNRLCLRDGRFAVEADWELPPSGSGAARAVPLTARSGWFWFFRPQAPELLVKVLDDCGGEQPAFWVFAGGLTDLGVTLRVTDMVADQTREYINPPGRPFEPVQDTAAFTTCP